MQQDYLIAASAFSPHTDGNTARDAGSVATPNSEHMMRSGIISPSATNEFPGNHHHQHQDHQQQRRGSFNSTPHMNSPNIAGLATTGGNEIDEQRTTIGNVQQEGGDGDSSISDDEELRTRSFISSAGGSMSTPNDSHPHHHQAMTIATTNNSGSSNSNTAATAAGVFSNNGIAEGGVSSTVSSNSGAYQHRRGSHGGEGGLSGPLYGGEAEGGSVHSDIHYGGGSGAIYDNGKLVSSDEVDGSMQEVSYSGDGVEDDSTANQSMMGDGSEEFDTSADEVDRRSVYVGNVDYGATPQELQEHFKQCGAINRITIMVDRYSGHPKGFAYIEFAEEAAIPNAVELTDSLFRDRALKVTPKRKNIPGFTQTNTNSRGTLGGLYQHNRQQQSLRGGYGAGFSTTLPGRGYRGGVMRGLGGGRARGGIRGGGYAPRYRGRGGRFRGGPY